MDSADAPTEILRVTGLRKAYPGVKALDGISLTLRRGEVRALMGRNGAGKSTFVKILSGAVIPDSGKIEILGKPVSFGGPAEALVTGIATVYQELNTVPGLTVAENIMLGHWPSKNGLVNYPEMRLRAKQALDILGENMAPDIIAAELSIAERQICEIAHALSVGPKILILDEPTSSLPAHEVERVISATRRVADSGTAVIYVSHRMDEIARVADSVTVIRDGMVIATMPISQAPVDHIARLMIGDEFSVDGTTQLADPRDETVLQIRGLHAGERVKGVDLDLKMGEVVGIAGLLGSGRSELLRCIAGTDKISGGNITVLGQNVNGTSVGRRISCGVALVPEDRKSEGLVLDMPIAHNLVASCLRKIANQLGFLQPKSEAAITARSRDDFEIVCQDMQAPASSLSGGNQQKVVLGRCLNADAKVLLLDEPTRGVDVHAKAQIYELIARIAGSGMGVIVVSSEYEELLRLGHRVIVMRQGVLVVELDPKTTSMDELLALVVESSVVANNQLQPAAR